MILNEVIAELEALKAKHGGDIPVTLWEYAGGNDYLYDAKPVYDPQLEAVVMDTECRNASGAER